MSLNSRRALSFLVAPESLTGLGPKIRHYHQPSLLFNCYKYVNFLKCLLLPYFGAFPSFIEKPNKEVRKAEQIGLNVGECLASRWCRFWWWWDLRATPWDTLVERCPASNPGVGSGSGPGPISADKSILLALESKLCLAGR